MKIRVLALAFLLLMGILGGCSSGAPSDNAPDASSTGQDTTAAATPVSTEPLRIGWWGSQTRHDGTLAVLDMYTEKTGVQFEPEFYSFDDYISKLNTLIAANDAPDIMQMGGNFPTYIDHIEMLNEYIDKGLIDVSNTDESFIAITTLEGKTVGISLGTNAQAMAYDPEIFKSAGVELPHDKWTWEDYEKAAVTIHEKLGILGSSRLDPEFRVLTSFIQQWGTGESFFLEPYRLDLNYTNNDYVAEFFDMKNRLTKAGAYPNPAQMAEIKDIEGDPLVTGKAAMTWVSSNQFVALSSAADRPLALVFPPRRTNDGPLAQSIMSSQMFCIYKGSGQKEAAAEFISFFVNDIDANNILKGERGVPIMAPVREALSAGLSEPNKAVYDYLTRIGKEAALEIILDSPVQAEIQDIYDRLSEEVVFGRITPAQAAENLRTEAEGVLSRAR